MTLSHPLMLSHHFWEDQLHKRVNRSAPFRILVAGGGTGDATLYFAEAFPRAGLELELVHLDLSNASISIARQRFEARGLSPPQFISASIFDLPQLQLAPFDLINCVGVLHHLADPVDGVRTLASALKDDGVLAAMVYGEYGRTGLYDLQSIMRTLKKHQPETTLAEDLKLLKNVFAQLPNTHRYKANSIHGGQTLDGISDEEWIDRFLHPCDQAFTVPKLFQLLRQAGMAPSHLLPAAQYDPQVYLDTDELRPTLPPARRSLAQFAPLGLGTADKAVGAGAGVDLYGFGRTEEQATLAELLSGNIAMHFVFAVKPPRMHAMERAHASAASMRSATDLLPTDVLCRTALLPSHYFSSPGRLSTATEPVDHDVTMWHLTTTFSAVGYETLRLADCRATLEQQHARLRESHGALANDAAFTWAGFQALTHEMLVTAASLGMAHVLKRGPNSSELHEA